MISQPGAAAFRRALLLAAAVVGVVTVQGAAAGPGNGGPAQIVVLSNRADLVSGGDASSRNARAPQSYAVRAVTFVGVIERTTGLS
jgi:hypothetical protein